jgi:hypothetical protein
MSYKTQDHIPYDKAYSDFNLNTSFSLEQIDMLRQPLIQQIATLNLNKHRLRSDEYHQLVNYHNYALNILNNMKNIKQVEMLNPYNQHVYGSVKHNPQPSIDSINPYGQNMKVVYQSDGRTKIVPLKDDMGSKKYKGEWETQFDENIHNPPSYMIPPSNKFVLSQNKK